MDLVTSPVILTDILSQDSCHDLAITVSFKRIHPEADTRQLTSDIVFVRLSVHNHWMTLRVILCRGVNQTIGGAVEAVINSFLRLTPKARNSLSYIAVEVVIVGFAIGSLI